MSLMRWDPNDFDRFRDDLNRFWSRMRAEWNLDQTEPRTHLHRTETGYLVEFELAGVDPNDVDIEVDMDSVTVRGVFPADPLEADRRAGERFEAVVELPTEIDPDQATADWRHGLLVVRCARTQTRRRQIPIAGSS